MAFVGQWDLLHGQLPNDICSNSTTRCREVLGEQELKPDNCFKGGGSSFVVTLKQSQPIAFENARQASHQRVCVP
jgi:hypothetical protein